MNSVLLDLRSHSECRFRRGQCYCSAFYIEILAVVASTKQSCSIQLLQQFRGWSGRGVDEEVAMEVTAADAMVVVTVATMVPAIPIMPVCRWYGDGGWCHKGWNEAKRML